MTTPMQESTYKAGDYASSVCQTIMMVGGRQERGMPQHCSMAYYYVLAQPHSDVPCLCFTYSFSVATSLFLLNTGKAKKEEIREEGSNGAAALCEGGWVWFCAGGWD